MLWCRELEAELEEKAGECAVQMDIIRGMREEYRALVSRSGQLAYFQRP